MELNGFTSEDYIYLRVFDEVTIITSKYSDGKTVYPKGKILRFKKEDLEWNVFSRHFPGIYGFDVIDNPECSKAAVMPYDKYSIIRFKEDKQVDVCLWPDETYSFGAWLCEKITGDDRPMISIFDFDSPQTKVGKNLNSIRKSPATINEENQTLTVGKRNIDLYLDFKAGEELDFKNRDVASLFLDHNYMKLLSHCETIADPEKEALFAEDFKYTFQQGDHFYQFYMLNPEIKVKTEKELREILDFYSIRTDIKRDDDGYIRYVYFADFDMISRDKVAKMLKFATPVPVIEARKHLSEIERVANEKQEQEMAAWRKKQQQEQEELEVLYEGKKNDASLFPGVNGNFIHTMPHTSSLTNPNASIEEVREFYKRLKEINSAILQGMYFYGGTLPYILTNARDCRSFGDVDIFVPVSMMSDLREELKKQSSFRIFHDSKYYTESYNLTSRVYKKEIAKKDPIEEASQFLSLITSPNINNTVDSDGKNIFESFIDSGRSYYQVPQDFGFKGSLFGINISVFPIYDYKNNLMAKSFNIRDMYQFLLGVRVMNNTKLSDFVRSVNVFDSDINILPLEYTIVSKESAIKEGYIKRTDKDAIDLAYIEEHKKELGISDEVIARLKANYPNYSVSVAYALQKNGTVETVSGEAYRKLILKDNGRVIS